MPLSSRLETLYFVVGLLGLALAAVWGAALAWLVRRGDGPAGLGVAVVLGCLFLAQALPGAGALALLRGRWRVPAVLKVLAGLMLGASVLFFGLPPIAVVLVAAACWLVSERLASGSKGWRNAWVAGSGLTMAASLYALPFLLQLVRR